MQSCQSPPPPTPLPASASLSSGAAIGELRRQVDHCTARYCTAAGRYTAARPFLHQGGRGRHPRRPEATGRHPPGGPVVPPGGAAIPPGSRSTRARSLPPGGPATQPAAGPLLSRGLTFLPAAAEAHAPGGGHQGRRLLRRGCAHSRRGPPGGKSENSVGKSENNVVTSGPDMKGQCIAHPGHCMLSLLTAPLPLN